MEIEDKTRLTILSPIEHGKKGTHRDLFEHLRKEGYIRVRVDGEMKLLEDVESLEKNKKHNIDVVVDRIVKGSDRSLSLIHISARVLFGYRPKGTAV